MLNLIHVDATSLSDAWFQTVYKCIEIGREFIVDRGSFEGIKRLEFDYITIHVTNPQARPLLPQIPVQYNIPNPVVDEYLDIYMPYLMTGDVKKGESYTYGSRLNKFLIPVSWTRTLRRQNKLTNIVVQDEEIWNNKKIIITDNDVYYLNQIELIIWIYKNKGFRNNQMVLQVAHPTDMLLKDPPCLRHIQVRIQDNKLHFIIYFRSWDLWSGMGVNLAGLQLMKEYMASEIGVGDGEMVVSSAGLHLYNYVWELAEIIRGKTIEQFRKGV